jgi:hypothetical protein
MILTPYQPNTVTEPDKDQSNCSVAILYVEAHPAEANY